VCVPAGARRFGDGPVKLFSAFQHGDGVITAQTRIPDETNETTQVKALLDTIDLTGAVVTGDAAHASRETAAYIAGERGADYLPLRHRRSWPPPQHRHQSAPPRRDHRDRPHPPSHSAATAPESSTSSRYRRRPIRLCRSRGHWRRDTAMPDRPPPAITFAKLSRRR
jgi:hypothetical protein